MAELQPKSSSYRKTDADATFVSVDSRGALITMVDSYPVLTAIQTRRAFGYKQRGQPLTALAADAAFIGGEDPKYEGLLPNAIADSNSITDLLVFCNLRLVATEARRHHEMEFEDAIQEGTTGLINAVEKATPTFDLENGVFATYAIRGIRNSLSHAIRGPYSKEVRLFPKVLDSVNLGRRISTELAASLGREPLPQELVQALMERGKSKGNATEAVTIIIHDTDRAVSLDKERSGNKRETLAAVLPDKSDGTEEQAINRIHLRQVGDTLTEVLSQRDADILRMRHGIGLDDPMFLDQIAAHLGISREAVRQSEIRSVTKLRHHRRFTALAEI